MFSVFVVFAAIFALREREATLFTTIFEGNGGGGLRHCLMALRPWRLNTVRITVVW